MASVLKLAPGLFTTPSKTRVPPSRLQVALSVAIFAAAVAFHLWGGSVGWESKNLPGGEFRQAQTALTTYYIKEEGNYSLSYPTPVLGKPWSIPMEFPLYQWTVVLASKLTNLSLTKAGRLVSLICFYLTLPALFLLLDRWDVPRVRRWLVLAVVASCPLYVYYGRAILIETMALMFAVWFWLAFERAVASKHRGWLVLAVVAGTGAGLVKVTTYLLYLLPAGFWAGKRLWQGRKNGDWRTDFGWMVAAVAVPFGASIWWVWQADAIKMLNPMADFLTSANLEGFNFGDTAAHFAPAYWAMKWRIVRDELTWLPAVAAVLLLGLAGARRWRNAGLACGLWFLIPLFGFPVLFALHDYYYVANTVLLLLAVGLWIVGLAEVPRLGWPALALTVALVAVQAGRYAEHYYPSQAGISRGGDALSRALNTFTSSDEYLVVTGQDWNSMLPYYTRRRALMLRLDSEADTKRIHAALGQLHGEQIGALAVTGQPWEHMSRLVRLLSGLGLAPKPWLVCNGTWIFLAQNRWEEVVRRMRLDPPEDVVWAEGAEPAPERLAGRWQQYAGLAESQKRLFLGMQPRPVRFYFSFEPTVQFMDSAPAFFAHPWTKLVFRLPAGRHSARFNVWFNPDALKVPPGERPTDGVEVAVRLLGADEVSQKLVSRLVDPVNRIDDRGVVPVRLEFTLDHEAEVELVFDPGSEGHDTRDWIWIRGSLEID